MSLFEYYAALRNEVLGIVSGTENTVPGLLWDNTTPNHITKNRLEKLFFKYLSAAKAHGILVVVRHSGCPNPSHGEYPTSNSYGLHIPYRSDEYLWNGGQFYQGSRLCVCPCSTHNEPTEHFVIEDVIYDTRANIDICNRLELILSDIFESINNAGDKKPRSAIREHLLRAVLRINDELLPEPMSIYIERHSAKAQPCNAQMLVQRAAQGE